MKPFIPVVTFLLATSNCLAQTNALPAIRDTAEACTFTRNLCLWTGYYSYGRNALEIGIGKITSGRVGFHPFSSGCYFSSEVFEHGTWFIGPKAGVWASGGSGAITMGLSIIDYTNFKVSSLQLRPEIGVGLEFFRIYYARNLRLTSTDFDAVNKNVLGINFSMNIKRLKDKTRVHPGGLQH